MLDEEHEESPRAWHMQIPISLDNWATLLSIVKLRLKNYVVPGLWPHVSHVLPQTLLNLYFICFP